MSRSITSGCLSDEEAADLLHGAPWRRLAVLGDSLAEGIGEDTPGYPPGGWAATLARVLHRVNPDSTYLNVGQRDLLTREVRATQLRPALGFGPDLAVLVCGGNDLLNREFDLASVAADLDDMVRELRRRGGDVLLFGLMDITTTGLIDPRFAPSMHERLVALADVNRCIAERRGAIYLPMTEHPAASDPEVYSSDRLHANGRGHAVLAGAVVRRLAQHVHGLVA
jgi:lysophospholipase L1-like esterase